MRAGDVSPAPIAFMVMPFGVKQTGVSADGVPAAIDFDALWERIHEPLLKQMGYRAVRADQEVGALIISEMIQRLTLADLVVADLSLPNPNVYYEVGVRHAAKRIGCVLVAADWARPMFDLAQFRQLRYPLVDGQIGAEASRAATAALAGGLVELATGSSPVFQAVPGYPDKADIRDFPAFEETLMELSNFDVDVRTICAGPTATRRARAEQVVSRYSNQPVVREFVALALLRVVRDHIGWAQLIRYIEELPAVFHHHPYVVEQRCLALANTGDAVSAAARLEALINAEGAASERLGLLGGRYKQLWRDATTAADRRRYLDRAIDAYERGMRLDLNAYYPASNLSRLYRSRKARGDEAKALEAGAITVAACRRALELGVEDEWVRPTLLAAAFDQGNVNEARRALTMVEGEGADAWKLASTYADLALSASHQAEPATGAKLTKLLVRFRKLSAGA